MIASHTGPYLLGIDYGTESCRVGIFTLQGVPVVFAATSYRSTHPRSGWAEQSPDDWYSALIASTRRAMDASGLVAGDIAGIGFAATSATVVALDKKNDPLRPAIMWMDVRAAKQASRAASALADLAGDRRAQTTPASAELFPFKAAWLKENEPEIYRQTAHLLDAPDWLGHKLTGEFRINENSAAVKMYHDRAAGGFPHDFYDAVGCGDVFDKMPGVVQPLGTPLGELTGRAASDLGLLAGTPVAEGCIDAYAGQIGLNVLTPGRMALITGSSHVLLGQAPASVADTGLVGTFADAVIEGQCSVEAAMVSSGSAMKWFRDTFAGDVVRTADERGLVAYDLLNEASKDIPPGIGRADHQPLLPRVADALHRFPRPCRGVGLSLRHTQAHFYHALQEAICYGVAHNLRNMAEHGYHVEQLVACGGALKSRSWIHMHADVTGVPIVLTEVQDAVALGSCVMAAAGAGLFSSVAEAAAAMVHEVETVEPDPERHQEYAYFVDQYIDTYPRLQALQHAMAEHLETTRRP